MSNVDVPPAKNSSEDDIESPVDGPIPDWMKLATSTSSAPSLSEENTPDWLKDIKSGKTGEAASKSVPPKDDPFAGMSDLERLLAEEGIDLGSVEEKRPEGAEGMSARDWMIATSDDEVIKKRIGAEAIEEPAVVEAAPVPFGEAADDDSFAGMSDLERLLAEEGIQLGSVAEERPEGAEGMSARDWMISTSDDELIKRRVGAGPVEETPSVPAPRPEPEPELSAGAESAADEDLPDWLRDVEEEATEPVTAVDDMAESFVDDEDLPDWLRDVEGGLTQESPQSLEMAVSHDSTEAEEDLPDWLRDVEEDEVAEEVPVTVMEVDDKMVVEEDLPDWLQEVEEEVAEEPQPAITMAGVDNKMVVDEDLPDWLFEAEEGEDVSEGISEPVMDSMVEEDLPDWLRDVEEDEAAEEVPVTVMEVDDKMVVEEDLPDWLQEVEEEVAEEPQPAITMAGVDDKMVVDEDLPDWLQEAEEDEIPVEPLVEATTAIMPDDNLIEEVDLPDWLREAEPDTVVEAGLGETDVFEDIADDEDLPDWLREVQVQQGAEEEPVVAVSPVPVPAADIEIAPTDELPDWLQEVEEVSATEDLFEIETVAEFDEGIIVEDELPDWLVDVSEEEPFEPSEPSPEEFEEVEVAEELPDWLQAEEIGSEEAVEEVVEVVAAAEVIEAPKDELAPPIEVIPEPEPVQEPAPQPVMAVAPGGMPDWLRKLRDTSDEEEPAPIVTTATAISRPMPEPRPVAEVSVEPAPEPAPVPDIELPSDPDERLKLAQAARDEGAIDKAVRIYDSLVINGVHLDTVIDDMELTIRSYPSNYQLYQVMGDAMMKDGRLQSALEAYRAALSKLSS